MKKYFNTKDAAQRHLEWRRKCAYDRIEERNDKLLRDGSRVFKDAQDNKWKVRMLIWTEQMIKDIEKMEGFKYEDDPMALIPFSEEEKMIKVEHLRKIFLRKHKTNEIEDLTI